MNDYEFVSPCSIPAVLCSNNWQSPFSNAVNQPSTSNHETNVTSVPIVVHHLPEFDQDSWTNNPPTRRGRTKNTVTESFITTQPPDQTNNNNNTFSTGSSVARCHSASDRQSPSNEALDHICMSDSDRHSTGQLSTLMTTNRMTAEPPASGQTLAFSAAANGTGSAMTIPHSQLSQLVGSTDEFQATNAVASETMTTNDMAGEPQTNNEMSSRQPTANGSHHETGI